MTSGGLMPLRISFYLDEHAPNALAQALRRRGIDVLTTAEAGMLGAKDREQLARAHAEGRVVYTRDEDYPILHALGVPHSGIVYLPQAKPAPLRAMIDGLELIHGIFAPEEMVGRLEYL